MSNDRLRQMEAFCAVIDTGGFGAAATRLGISQPAVSKAISSLESRLGITLLNRTTRGQNISVEGVHYLVECRKILELVGRVEDGFISQTSGASGLLRVSVPVSFGVDQINPILPTFIADNPDIQIELSVTDRIENLVDGQIDVAFRMGDLDNSSHITRALCNLDRIIVAAPKYLQKYGVPKSADDLKNRNCLMWKGNAHHLNTWPLFESDSRKTIRVYGNFRSNNGMSLIAACLDGIGIMRMAEHVALPLIELGKLVQVLKDNHQPDDQAVHIVFHRDKQNIKRVRKFVDYCVEEFRTPKWEHAAHAAVP